MSAQEQLSVAANLTDLEMAILEFERNWWRYAGAKESSIKELFDMDAPKYYRLPLRC